MKQYSITQAAAALHINQSTLWRWMERANIKAIEDVTDKRRRYLTDEQVKQLRKMHQHAPIAAQKDTANIADTLQTIQQQLDSMQDEIHALERRLDALQMHDKENVPASKRERATRPIIAYDGIAEESSTLPDGYVSFNPFVEKLHHVPASTAKHRLKARDVLIQGKWKQDGHAVLLALDASGRHTFYEEFAGHEKFTKCPDCPHEVLS